MSVQRQEELESVVNQLIEQHGVEKAVQIIKAKPAKGLFEKMQNYPNGVFIMCNSEKGGVLVGERS